MSETAACDDLDTLCRLVEKNPDCGLTARRARYLMMLLGAPPQLYLIGPVLKRVVEVLEANHDALYSRRLGVAPDELLDNFKSLNDLVANTDNLPTHWVTAPESDESKHPLVGVCAGTSPIWTAAINDQAANSAKVAYARLFAFALISAARTYRLYVGERTFTRYSRAGEPLAATTHFDQFQSSVYLNLDQLGGALRHLSEDKCAKLVDALGRAESHAEVLDLLINSSPEIDALAQVTHEARYLLRSLAVQLSKAERIRKRRSGRRDTGWPQLPFSAAKHGNISTALSTVSALEMTADDDNSSVIVRWASQRESVDGQARDRFTPEHTHAHGLSIEFPVNRASRLEGRKKPSAAGNRSDRDQRQFVAQSRMGAEARRNQELPNAWHQPTAAEIEYWKSHVVDNRLRLDVAPAVTDEELDPHHLVTRMILSQVSLGRPAAEIAEVSVVNSGIKESGGRIDYVLDKRAWRIPIPVPAYSELQQTSKEMRVCNRVVTFLYLPDLVGLWQFLGEFEERLANQKKPRRLNLLRLDNNEKRLAEWKNIERSFLQGAPRELRVSFDSIHRLLRTTLLRMTRDAACAAVLCGDTSLTGQTLRHYTTLDIDQICDLYVRGIESVWGIDDPSAIKEVNNLPINDPMYVGARLCPTDSHLQHWVESKREELMSWPRLGPGTEWRLFHNAYCIYTATWLCQATAMRAAIDPWPEFVDLELGLCVIDDKCISAGYMTRLGYLPRQLRQQLRNFQDHCVAVEHMLVGKRHRHDSAMFYLIDEQFRCSPLRPKDITTDGELVVPANALRRYMRSKLMDSGVPGEFINAYLGHWENGMEPFDAHSSLAPMSLLDTLAPTLEHVDQSLGWRAIKSPLAT